MKKIMLFVLIFLMALSCAYSVGRVYEPVKSTLVLKAYKNRISGENSINVYITDAITTDESHYNDNLGYLDENRSLDLSSAVPELIGDLSLYDPEIIVFSYRVESNIKDGNFRIDISANGPFKSESADSTIDFEWALRHVSFSSDGAAVLNEEGHEEWNWGNLQFEYVVDIYKEQYEINVKKVSDSDNSLYDQWNVKNDDGDAWYRRGGIALLIDRNQYNSASVGNYKTTVTVKLTEIT